MVRLHAMLFELAVALAGLSLPARASIEYEVTFNVTTELQNVFIYGDEFNGDVYAWDLFPLDIGTVHAGRSTFKLGAHDLKAWAILATRGQSAVAPGINNSLSVPPDGQPFESVFPGYAETDVYFNVATLYTGGAYNVPQAFYLTEFVLAVEDTLKTDFPTAVLHVFTFSNGVDVGTATFGIAPPCVPCDANCDGSINQFDIQSFVDTLSGQTGCSPCAADTNADGSINQFDIQGFVGCLGG